MDFDPTFLKRFREGELSALHRIYREHVDDIHRLSRFGFSVAGPPPRRVPPLRSPAEQNDFVQEVFVRAFAERARLAYDGLRPYRPYLLQVARNLRIDQIRKSGRELLVLDDPAALDIDALIQEGGAIAEPDEEDFDRRRLEVETEAFVAAQDAETQDFVRLRFVEELSQAEVAERLGATRRRVRTLEARVQADLRAHLKKRGLWAPAAPDRAARNGSTDVVSQGGPREER
jgi:RNA polymerase sigma-70 factor (ECF subfamily)